MSFTKPLIAAPSDAVVLTSEVRALGAELKAISADMQKATSVCHDFLELVQPSHRSSADNLLRYLSLRQRDLRALQPRLSQLGLSSLGRSEGQVQASVDAVARALRALETFSAVEPITAVASQGRDLLIANTQTLLGAEPAGRRVRIMVTMPGEAAHDYTLVHELIRAGMDCMRINCAHDDATAWASMIEHLRRANHTLGRTCQVAMDLGGPKLRTGPVRAGPAVVRVCLQRDAFGRVTAAARVWLAPNRSGRRAPASAQASLPLPREWLRRCKVGETLRFTDARGANRKLKVTDVTADGVWAEARQTCYIVPGTTLRSSGAKGKAGAGIVGALAACEGHIVLHVGDTLVITRNLEPGRAATHDDSGQVLTPASIGCTLPEVFEDVRSGERIWLDDGRIGAVVETVEPDRVVTKVDHARARGEKLQSDKGINLPDSALRLPALTEKDLADLEFVVRHADMVSLSFANSAGDVELLQRHLKRLDGEKLGIILKIETRRGFEALPEMLFSVLRSTRCGVMIARGDLAVECGFERLAELQEEILWICEAAHVPVIWATQVLERLAKDGVPSRAEITDAAMSERAECVMLNKGPHILAAVHVLDDILIRMQTHVTKKRSMLRELRLAQRFLQGQRDGEGSVTGNSHIDNP